MLYRFRLTEVLHLLIELSIINNMENAIQPNIPPVSPIPPSEPKPHMKLIVFIVIFVVVGLGVEFLWQFVSRDDNQPNQSLSNDNNIDATIEENFVISFPSSPEIEDGKTEETSDQPATISRTYDYSDKDGNYYSLMVTKYIQDPIVLSTEQLDAILTTGMNSGKVKPTDEFIWQKFGYLEDDRIIEYLLQTQAEGISFLIRSRELLKGNNLYITKVVYQPDLLNDLEVNKFIESFKFKK